MEPQNGLIINESSEMVNIYCTFSCNPPEIFENQTIWFKDGRELITLNDSNHFVSHHSGYPILTIVNPNRNDSGVYHCSVSNSIGKGIPEVGTRLNVLYPPEVNLLIYPNALQGFSIKEGDDVRMICEITDGNPQNITKVRWLKNEDELVNETSQKEIVWLNVERNLAGNYTCKAQNDAGWSEASEKVEIDVNYLPGKAYIRQINGKYAIKNHNLTLECVVLEMGQPLAIEYQWSHDNLIIQNEIDSILHLTNINLKNRGNISCAAVNKLGIGPKGFFQLDPFASPDLIESLPPAVGTIFNASYFSLSCRVECFPICNITWKKDKDTIENSIYYQVKNSVLPEEDDSNRFTSVISTLIWNMTTLGPLDRVLESNITYSCISSSNIVGQGVESKTKFFVECKIKLFFYIKLIMINFISNIDPPENLRITPNRVDVIEHDIPPRIVCDSEALPPATYRWQAFSYWDKFVEVIADTQVLSMNNSIGKERSGTYTCIASNRHGESKIDVLINVLCEYKNDNHFA